MHFAAAIEVGDSVQDPAGYYDNNVSGTITLLRAAQAAGIDRLFFSSTCATYGIPKSIPMKESHTQIPIKPTQTDHRADFQGSRFLSGLSIHLFALFQRCRSRSAGKNWGMAFAGNSRQTSRNRSGSGAAAIFWGRTMTRATCVRDFVHVLDLADAHTRAIEHLLDHGASRAVNRRYRSGNYREGLEALEHVIGRGFNVKYGHVAQATRLCW
jgi:UDP-glucose 4-epimerase